MLKIHGAVYLFPHIGNVCLVKVFSKSRLKFDIPSSTDGLVKNPFWMHTTPQFLIVHAMIGENLRICANTSLPFSGSIRGWDQVSPMYRTSHFTTVDSSCLPPVEPSPALSQKIAGYIVRNKTFLKKDDKGNYLCPQLNLKFNQSAIVQYP